MISCPSDRFGAVGIDNVADLIRPN